MIVEENDNSKASFLKERSEECSGSEHEESNDVAAEESGHYEVERMTKMRKIPGTKWKHPIK